MTDLSLSNSEKYLLRNVEISRTTSSDLSIFNFDQQLKYLSLIVLVVQNASQVLLIHYARTRQTEKMFLSTEAVFWTEVVKLVSCISIVSIQEHSFYRCVDMIRSQLIGQPIDTLKVCIPSIIYTVQNNLLYIAVSNLGTATFMVTYQLKILTTALFSVMMLRKSLSLLQWLALAILFVGVSIVQLQEQSSPNFNSTSNALSTNLSSFSSPFSTFVPPSQLPSLGLLCVISASLLSGFSNIYFEKILKSSQVTVWMRNIQLSVLAIPVSYMGMQLKDGSILRVRGLFWGFDSVVWIIVLIYAVGGLTVAVVIKYADNILKVLKISRHQLISLGFATSVSILLSCLMSAFLFNFRPNGQFIIGTLLVMSSIYVYSKYQYKKKADL